jgi:hypothetical protein
MIMKNGPLTAPSALTAGGSISAPASGAVRTAPQDTPSEPGGEVYGMNLFALQQSVMGIPIMREDFITYTDLMPAE